MLIFYLLNENECYLQDSFITSQTDVAIYLITNRFYLVEINNNNIRMYTETL